MRVIRRCSCSPADGGIDERLQELSVSRSLS